MSPTFFLLANLPSSPYGGLYLDANGNLIGTTSQTDSGGTTIDGTVFELPFAGIQQFTTDFINFISYSGYGAITPLVVFDGASGSGLNPTAGLTADANGDLFGTTAQGGTGGQGTIFEIPRTGAGYGIPTTVYNFGAAPFPPVGGTPQTTLFIDSSGDLIGTTTTGGFIGEGSVFELVPNGSGYTPFALHSFSGQFGLDTDGALPTGSLVADANGDLFGVTDEGGASGRGTLYELLHSGGDNYQYVSLYSFGSDAGEIPAQFATGVTIDVNGNLFVTTEASDAGAGGFGGVFEIPKNGAGPFGYGAPITLATGIDARGAAVGDANGNLYVMDHFDELWEIPTTGDTTPILVGAAPQAFVQTVGGNMGSLDGSSLIVDTHGNLYDTTINSDTSLASVFEIANSGFNYPTLTSVQVAINAGTVVQAGHTANANAGDTVHFGVTFSATLLLSGTPSLSLSNGATATYVGQSGTTFDFDYVVQPGEATSHLTITSFNLNGGRIYDTFLNEANISNPVITGTVEIEQLAPPPPTNLADAGIVNGIVSKAHDGPAQTVTGNAEPGATVTVFDIIVPGSPKVVGIATANSLGSWIAHIGTLSDGPHELVATATNAVGTGQASSPLSFSVDTGPSITDNTTAGETVAEGATVAIGTVTPGLPGDTLTLTQLTGPAGAVTLDNGTVSFTAPASTGDFAFSYRISDQLGNLSAVVSDTLTVTPPLDPGPTAGAAHLYISPGLSADLTSQLLALDTPGLPGDTLTLTAVGTAGTVGTVSLSNGNLTYTAPPKGSDAFTYTVSDQLNDSATAGVEVSLVGKNGDVALTGSGNIVITAGGNHSVSGGSGHNFVSLGDGNDSVSLAGDNNTVLLGDGNDNVSLPGSNNTVTLGNGNDTVLAGANSRVTVGNGNDTVYAGANDTITLGSGHDTVAFGVSPNSLTIGNETVSNFGSHDTLEFNQLLISNYAAAIHDSHQVGLDTVITVGQNDTVTLQGVAMSSLTASSFRFV